MRLSITPPHSIRINSNKKSFRYIYPQIYCLDSGSCVPLDRSCKVDWSQEDETSNAEENIDDHLCISNDCSKSCKVSWYLKSHSSASD